MWKKVPEFISTVRKVLYLPVDFLYISILGLPHVAMVVLEMMVDLCWYVDVDGVSWNCREQVGITIILESFGYGISNIRLAGACVTGGPEDTLANEWSFDHLVISSNILTRVLTVHTSCFRPSSRQFWGQPSRRNVAVPEPLPFNQLISVTSPKILTLVPSWSSPTVFELVTTIWIYTWTRNEHNMILTKKNIVASLTRRINLQDLRLGLVLRFVV